jgi:hypothetical protein
MVGIFAFDMMAAVQLDDKLLTAAATWQAFPSKGNNIMTT